MLRRHFSIGAIVPRPNSGLSFAAPSSSPSLFCLHHHHQRRFHGIGGCCGGSGGSGDHHHSSHLSEFLGKNSSKTAPNPDLEWCKTLTLAGAGVNVFYSVLKISLGGVGGSVALVADGLHAVVDVASDAVALISLRLSSRTTSSRCTLPFGTGRSEAVGAVIIATILIAGAFGVAWSAIEKLFEMRLNQPSSSSAESSSSSVAASGWAGSSTAPDHHDHQQNKFSSSDDSHHHDHHHHHHSSASFLSHEHNFEILRDADESNPDEKIWSRVRVSMLLVAVSSIFAKEILYRLMRKAGEKAGSTSVVANALHHRADALCAGLGTFGVVAAASPGPLAFLDPLAGLGVAAVILQIGWKTLQGSLLQFFDYQGGELANLRSLARGTTKHGTVVNVFATRHGAHQYVIHGTLLMQQGATCADVADLEQKILKNIVKEHPQNALLDVFFKVKPFDLSKNNIDDDFIVALKEVAEFHGVAMSAGAADAIDIDFDKKELVLSKMFGADCMSDIERCAEMFGFTVVRQKAV